MTAHERAVVRDAVAALRELEGHFPACLRDALHFDVHYGNAYSASEWGERMFQTFRALVRLADDPQ